MSPRQDCSWTCCSLAYGGSSACVQVCYSEGRGEEARKEGKRKEEVGGGWRRREGEREERGQGERRK